MRARTKYPRTPHLPWSPGCADDDRIISAESLRVLDALPTVITEKMDGGNITLMRDAMYARSVDSGTPVWETRSKAEWARVAGDIPDGFRVSCESVWARRSVAYENLEGPLLVFGVWDRTHLLSWDDTELWAALLGLPTVPFIATTTGTRDALDLWRGAGLDESVSEGFVVRSSGPVETSRFADCVAKWVRAGHVQTRDDWRHRDDFPLNGFRTPACSLSS